MDDATSRLRVEHALFRSKSLKDGFRRPVRVRGSRFRVDEPVVKGSYSRPSSTVRRVSFVDVKDDGVDAVREAFFESRQRLYDRLSGNMLGDDCGCGE